MDERERRAAENEIVFREVNERLEALNIAFGTLSEHVQIVCECPDLGCIDRIEMTLAAYEQLRDDPAAFAVAPGHVAPEVENVVASFAAYQVVRKHDGGPAELARSEDPRDGTGA